MFNNPLFTLIGEMAYPQLKQENEFLKAENAILRNHNLKIRIILTDAERNTLIRLGRPLGSRLKDVIQIVKYRSFRRWVQQMNGSHPPKHTRGRPRSITLFMRETIVLMARKNKGWGYPKIMAECKKIFKKKISESSIKNILKEYGVDPMPSRSKGTWNEFLFRTFQTLYACDFFQKEVWTPLGRRIYYILFFIDIKTRKVHIAGITDKITQCWLLESIKNLDPVFQTAMGKSALIHDGDIHYKTKFKQHFKDLNIKPIKISPGSPNMNPFAESWVATIKRECLNQFLVIGKAHLEYLVHEFVTYYNNFRPHSSKDHEPLTPLPKKYAGRIKSKSFLGGLHHHYYRE